MPLLLRKISLSHFRSYDAFRLDLQQGDSAAALVVLTGPNGAGKTNILEAISLLTPGRGLRGAELGEMKNTRADGADLWAISAELEAADGDTLRIGTGIDRTNQRRVIRINGQNAKNQDELSTAVAAVWLTPQMDRLFLDGTSARRRFLDRLVFAFEPAHATRLNRYDKTLRERMKILQDSPCPDTTWLTQLEARLASDAVAIAASRTTLLNSLQKHARTLNVAAPLFPEPHIVVSGWVENAIATQPAVTVEDELRAKLRDTRTLDRTTGRTQDGTHRSDMVVTYLEKNMPAAQCSTGEQKALLVSITLAHARMMKAEKGFVPIILLDEVAAHLDEARRLQLFAQLRTLGGQIWLTGTDDHVFAPLENDAKIFRLS